MTQEEKEITTGLVVGGFIICIVVELIAHGYGVRRCASVTAILIAFLMSSSALVQWFHNGS